MTKTDLDLNEVSTTALISELEDRGELKIALEKASVKQIVSELEERPEIAALSSEGSYDDWCVSIENQHPHFGRGVVKIIIFEGAI